MPNQFFAIIALMISSTLAGCTMLPVTKGAAPDPANYSDRKLSAGTDAFPNWPATPARSEELLLNHSYTIESERGAGAGTTGAKMLVLKFPQDNISLKVKWKQMKRGWIPFWERLDGVNNSPRKEIAAWKIQELLFDAEDFVVPLSLAQCLPVEEYSNPSISPTQDGSNCVLGVYSIWLHNLKVRDPLLENDRFNSDYAYAYYLSNLNLFTYLVKHHDGREGNFLVSKEEQRPQVFSIDNGVAFGQGFNGLFYNWFVPNWNSMRVPALQQESIARLENLTINDLVEKLGVVAELELGADGIYRNVPLGKNIDQDKGVRITGNTIQLGLTHDEIVDIWNRIAALTEDVAKGKIAVF